MTIFTKRIQTGTDDGRVTDAPSYNNSSASITIGHVGGNESSSWYRFPVVTIPQSSTINSAKVTFRATVGDFGNPNPTSIFAEDAANPTFPTDKADYDSRVMTTASITNWNPGDWVPGNDEDTPDLVNIIQELVDRGDWNSGNAIIIFVKFNGSPGANRNVAVAYDGTPATSALLTIDYTPGGPTPTDLKGVIFWY